MMRTAKTKRRGELRKEWLAKQRLVICFANAYAFVCFFVDSVANVLRIPSHCYVLMLKRGSERHKHIREAIH
jgi:hypothetical protein